MLEHEKNLKPEIQKALDMIVPDESSKDRMYLEIMRRGAVQETKAKKKPWYMRWQISAGICTAAMACVIVAAASLHSKIPVDAPGELSVVTPSETSAVADIVGTETTAVFTEGQTQTQTSVAAIEQTTVTAAMTAAAVKTTPAKQAAPVQTEAPVPVKKPAATAATAEPKPVQTTALPQETIPVPTDNAVDTTPAETTMTAAMTSDVPLRQNIYLYYELNYRDINYCTQYETISGSQLTYLGPGVTSGADVDDMHTVLIYAIDGVDASQQLAVQYAGETAFYIFHAVTE